MTATCVVVDRSSHLTATAVDSACKAATKWAAAVALAWDVPAVTVTTSKTAKPTFGVIVLQDGLDQPGAAGYHDVEGGRPVGKVDVAGTAAARMSWTVTLTHELGEMMVDPWCVAAAQYARDSWIAFELCDPVEGDQFALAVDGVACSDYLLPGYFAGSAPFDAGGHLTASAPALLAQGYASVCVTGKWSQVAHGELPARAVGSRRHALRVALAGRADR